MSHPSIQSLLERPFSCACGHSHAFETRQVILRSGAIEDLRAFLADCDLGGKTAIICDENTRPYAREILARLPEDSPVRLHAIPGAELHANEYAVGSALLHIPPDAAYLIAVGSGTIQDVTRFVAHRMGIPYVGVATAPSMDGYTSGVAAMLRAGAKTTLEAAPPRGMLCDIDWLKDAPARMIAAGLGDVAGKLTSLADWRLSVLLTGETLCPQIEALTRDACEKCLSSADGLAARDPEAIRSLTEGLLLSGLAIQLNGNSRPASGAEHHLSHYLETVALLRGEPVSLHGDKVGMATLQIMGLYARFFQGDPPQPRPMDRDAIRAQIQLRFGATADAVLVNFDRPPMPDLMTLQQNLHRHWAELCALASELSAQRGRVRDALKRAGGPVRPADMGISRDDFTDALRLAHVIRPRFTIQWLLMAYGWLDEIALTQAEEAYACG